MSNRRAPSTRKLQAACRLSESVIWGMQRSFYEAEGPDAWKPRGIPFWMTSNTFFARAMARVVHGFVRDAAAVPEAAALDTSAPLYVLELASGSGQFAFVFLKRLLEMKRSVPALQALDIRYVMTDLAESNVRAWRAHERLRPFVEAGLLDFAVFDIDRGQELRLLESGRALDREGLRNPLVVLANYAFDSTRQDCFRIEAGTLRQDLVTTVLEGRQEAGARDDTLQRVRLRFEPAPMAAAYYDDPAFNDVLEAYRTTLGDTTFLFPVGALRCLRRLLDLSAGRMFLLCGDKAVAHEQELRDRGDPPMTLHGGCFSFMVNLHAIGLFFERNGGVALHARQHAPGFQVSGFACGLPGLPETRQAFHSEVDGFGPAEFFTLLKDLCDRNQAPPLDVLLALLKLSDGDAEVVYRYRDLLVKHARAATALQRQDLRRTLAQVWDGYYPLHKDLAFQLARVSLAMSQAADAVRYCEASLRLFGDNQGTELMLAYAHSALGHRAEGLRCVERALALQPDYPAALELRARLREAGTG